MAEEWKQVQNCIYKCSRCEKSLKPDDQRILSVYDHQTICMACKEKEENASDYKTFSKKMIGQCMWESELTMADAGDYCYHHFYPYKC